MTKNNDTDEKPVVFLEPKGKMRVHDLITTRSHVNFLWHGINDHDITQYLSTSLPFYYQNEVDFVDGLAHKRTTDHVFIIADEHLEPIGINGPHRIDWVSRHATFGIALYKKSEWSKGYGTEALMLILDYAFARLNLERVDLDVLASNPRAQKVYERCGFRKEGVKRRHLFKNNTYHDSISMGILKDEWAPVWEEYKKKIHAK